MNTSDAEKWAGGSRQLLAKKLGISEPAISQWRGIPPKAVQLLIHHSSGGQIKAAAWCFAQHKVAVKAVREARNKVTRGRKAATGGAK